MEKYLSHVLCVVISHLRMLRVCLCVRLSDADGAPAKKRKRNESKEEILEMMENTENPLRCPIRLYEFYLSKWFVALLFMHFTLVVLLSAVFLFSCLFSC